MNHPLNCKQGNAYEVFLRHSRTAPMVTTLNDTFEFIALGKIMAPNPKPIPDPTLLHNDKEVIACSQYIAEHIGGFALAEDLYTYQSISD